MDPSRRRFLCYASFLVASSAMPLWARARDFMPLNNAANPNAWPIMQGPTDATSATLIILHEAAADFSPHIFGANNELVPWAFTQRWPLPGGTLMVSEICVSNLLVGVDYRLQLVDGGGNILDQRTFGALDVSREQCRFAVISCMNDSVGGTASTWELLYKENCDFVVFLGDTCYSDQHNTERTTGSYARRYAQTRSKLAWFKMPKLTPVFATWDDHDFGFNNGYKDFAMAPFMGQMFRTFFGTKENANWRKAYGVGSVFEGFGQRFYFMDDRSYRDNPMASRKRHWGAEQTDWLLQDLASSNKPAWLMNGSQFFGAYLDKESIEGDYAEDFNQILARLRQISAPVVFASGDIHASEVMKIEEQQLGYGTYEFTSSAIHSIRFPFAFSGAVNPRRIGPLEEQSNFMVFDVDVSKIWNMHVRCLNKKGALSFSGNFEISRG